MLKIRIIPTLLLRNNRMVKGKQFQDYRDTGDPVYAARVYNSQYVDELIFLDIDATEEGRPTNLEVIEQVSRECFMPLTLGGGITSVEAIQSLLKAGADKVVINSAAVRNPDLVRQGAERFGCQCIIVGIDVKWVDGQYRVIINSGRETTDLDLKTHIQHMESLGAGEIFINSIDRDGMMEGYDLDLIRLATSSTQIPVIACGGAGNLMHLVEGFKETEVKALAMASIYHFGDNNPIRARAYLKNHQITPKVV